MGIQIERNKPNFIKRNLSLAAKFSLRIKRKQKKFGHSEGRIWSAWQPSRCIVSRSNIIWRRIRQSIKAESLQWMCFMPPIQVQGLAFDRIIASEPHHCSAKLPTSDCRITLHLNGLTADTGFQEGLERQGYLKDFCKLV